MVFGVWTLGHTLRYTTMRRRLGTLSYPRTLPPGLLYHRCCYCCSRYFLPSSTIRTILSATYMVQPIVSSVDYFWILGYSFFTPIIVFCRNSLIYILQSPAHVKIAFLSNLYYWWMFDAIKVNFFYFSFYYPEQRIDVAFETIYTYALSFSLVID